MWRRNLLVAWLCLAGLIGCRQDMHDQPRYEPLEASPFFADGLSARPQVPGTVARGQLRLDTHLHAGKIAGQLATTLPLPLTLPLLERGRERYNIYCAPCHDRVGNGQGPVVRRGFRQPPSFHIQRLRDAPVGHFFDVITNGFGAMLDYSASLKPPDRWAIAAYIRAMQLSQHARLEDAIPAERRRLQEQNP